MAKDSDDSEYYEIEAIRHKKKVGAKWMYHVKWEGYPEDQNTWEPIDNLENCRSILSDFEREYNHKSTKVMVQRTLKEVDFLPKAASQKLKPKPMKEIVTQIKNKSWFSRATEARQVVGSKAKSDLEYSKGQSYSKSESRVMDYESLEAPVENVFMDRDNLSHTSIKQLSKLSESLPFNPQICTRAENEIIAPISSSANRTRSKTLLIEGLNKIITDPEIISIEIHDHLVIDGLLHFWVIGLTAQNERRSVGYFKNDVVKYSAPIELCTYYEKFIQFEDN